ncbi:MAG: YifB family Mg chelatase-like AAA ATPase [Patescibacteria group bacterium]
MITKIFTVTTLGLKAQKIEVETGIHPGLPATVMVGLPDKAVQESRERIKSSVKQSGFDYPLGKVTINLAPADIIKSGSSFDLPIAISILKLTGAIKSSIDNQSLFVGELSLDGHLRSVNGVLTLCLWAKEKGYRSIYIPTANVREAALVSGISIYGISTLQALVKHLNGDEYLKVVEPINLKKLTSSSKLDLQDGLLSNDMAYIKGQGVVKRALEIAASGGHNVLLIGEPGSGKTLLARSYPTILPTMTEKEILDVTQIYSVAGLLKDNVIVTKRPFRSPHHSASHIALVGGGSRLKPGEISLSNRGVLFLDEFPEFSRQSIECLRQPLEDGYVSIARATGSVTYPSRFYLIAAANPTPSGYNKPSEDYSKASQSAINRYQSKFSGPILDRIDLQINVNRVGSNELQDKELDESSSTIRARVQESRDIQIQRYRKESFETNSEMSLPMVDRYCELDSESKKLLAQAVDKFELSARSYMRVLKVARTIADLSKHDNISKADLAESLQYRSKLG